LIDNFREYVDKYSVEEIVPILKNITAKYGKYVVYGNHDLGGGALDAYRTLMEAGEFRLLVNETVSFRVGETTVSISKAEIADDTSYQMMQVNDATGTVKVNSPPVYSGDNNLSSLSVSPGTLSPAFSADQTEYSVTVPYDVKNINVSAGKSHGAARVAISSTELSVGQNTVTVTVTAENGNRKQYFIRVTRTESELAGITAQINGENYTVAHEPSVLAIPQGYTQSLAKLGEKDILVWTEALAFRRNDGVPP